MLGSCCHCVPLRGPDVPSRGATQEFLRRSSGSWKVPLTLIICAWQQERVRFASPEGFEVPSWSELAVGVRPPVRNIKDWEPGTYRGGRQHEAAARNPCTLMHRIVEHERVLFRSQSGPAAGTVLAVALSNPLVRVDSQLFRILLLRRLRLPLPPTSRTCRCGRLLDPFAIIVHRVKLCQFFDIIQCAHCLTYRCLCIAIVVFRSSTTIEQRTI